MLGLFNTKQPVFCVAEFTDCFVGFVLARLTGRVPALEAVACRYLSSRVGQLDAAGRIG